MKIVHYTQSFIILIIGFTLIIDRSTYFEGAVLITLSFILYNATKIIEKLEQKEKDDKKFQIEQYKMMREKK